MVPARPWPTSCESGVLKTTTWLISSEGYWSNSTLRLSPVLACSRPFSSAVVKPDAHRFLLDRDRALDAGADAGDDDLLEFTLGSRRFLCLRHARHAQRNGDRERQRGAAGGVENRTETISGALVAGLQMLGHG